MKVTVEKGEDGSLDDLFAKFDNLDFIEIDAGFLTPNNIHPGTETPLTDIAYLQQYGSEHHMIPERPFISDGAVLSEEGIISALPTVFKNYLKLGKGMASFAPIEKVSRESIAKAIAEQKFIKLSEKTLQIRREKGNHDTTILIDEGYLINGIESKTVRRKSKKS